MSRIWTEATCDGDIDYLTRATAAQATGATLHLVRVRAVEQAQAMGVDHCFSSCSPANLRILADAARYTGRFDLAEKSLLSLRRRSPGQAAAATFFLGRLYESRGRSADALRMYQQYLAGTPRGDYAEQSMAGRLRMLAATPTSPAAQAAAEAYLRRFPDGVHAPLARRVLEGANAP